jgi:dipeptidyl aminopeptidase/acylaminoacyl peptidase
MVGLGAAVVTLVVVAVVAFSRRGTTPVQPSSERQLTFTGDATSPAISPDGRKVVYVSYARGLVVQDLAGGDPTVLVPRARIIASPRWTGDGAAILFTMMRDTVFNGRLKLMTTWLVPSAGGPAREVLQDNSPADAGADSTTAAWVRRTPSNRIDIVGLSPFHVLRSLPIADSVGEIVDVAWSPDRSAVAFAGLGIPGIWVVPASGGEARRITRSGYNPRWSRPGDALYYLDGPAGAVDLLRVVVDRKKLQANGAPMRVGSIPAAGAFDVGPDGLVIHTQVAQSAQALAMTLPASGGGEVVDRHLLSRGTALVRSISLSADGRSVAYWRSAGGRSAIVLVPFEGGQEQELATSDTTWSSPSLAPDGTRLAFVRTDSEGTRAMLARLPRGQGPLSLGSRGVGSFGIPLFWWTADGTRVAYQVDDRKRIGVVNLADQSEVFIAVPDSLGTWYMGGALSPSGTQAVVSTLRQWNDWGELYITPVAGGPWRRVREPFGESSPLRWTAEGWLYLANHRVLISETGNMRMEVWRTRVPDGVPERVAVLPDGCGYLQIAVSADGQRAVCVLSADRTDLMVASGSRPAAR